MDPGTKDALIVQRIEYWFPEPVIEAQVFVRTHRHLSTGQAEQGFDVPREIWKILSGFLPGARISNQ